MGIVNKTLGITLFVVILLLLFGYGFETVNKMDNVSYTTFENQSSNHINDNDYINYSNEFENSTLKSNMGSSNNPCITTGNSYCKSFMIHSGINNDFDSNSIVNYSEKIGSSYTWNLNDGSVDGKIINAYHDENNSSNDWVLWRYTYNQQRKWSDRFVDRLLINYNILFMIIGISLLNFVAYIAFKQI